MHPILFHLPFLGWPVHAYGVLVTLGAWVGVAFVWQGRSELTEHPWRLAGWLTGVLLGALIGSRALGVLVLDSTPTIVEAASFWQPGRVLYGGVFAALLVGGPLAHALRLPTRVLADRVALGALAGLAIGRLGCLLAGDDYGRIAETLSGEPSVPWAVQLDHPTAPLPSELRGHWLHPAPAYLSLAAASLGIALALIRRWAPFAGATFCAALLGHAALRFGIESFRGDSERGHWSVLGWTASTSQWLAVVLATVALATAARWRGRRARGLSALRPARDADAS